MIFKTNFLTVLYCICFIVCGPTAVVVYSQGGDSCALAQQISVPGHDSGNTTLLSDQGGYTDQPDAWYRLDIPAGASCNIDTMCLSASSGDCWDTYLSIYDSTCTNEVYYSDDQYSICNSGECGTGWGNSDSYCQSLISSVVLGPGPATYYICCEGFQWSTHAGDGEYCLEITGSCTGWNCAEAVSNSFSCTTQTIINQSNADFPPGMNNWSSYNNADCLWDESGPEKVYYMINDTGEDQIVSLSLLNMTTDLDLFLMGDCSNDAWTCDDETVLIYVPNSDTNYVSVDGYNGNIGEYDLDVVTNSYCDYVEETINCGDTLTTQTTAGGPPPYSLWDDYTGCLTGMDGNEKLYRLDIGSDTAYFTAEISGSTTNLDLVVLQGQCDNDTACVGFGDTSITVNPAVEGTYYVVVDSVAGEEGVFDLSVTCSSTSPTGVATATPTNTLDCSGATTIFCGGNYSGSTSVGSNSAGQYSCVGYDESGNEKVYLLNLGSSTGVTLTLTPTESEDLDLFLLGSCDVNDCLDFSAGIGAESIDTVLDSGIYYVVVDGYRGASGAFQLAVSCGATATPTATITPTPLPPTDTPTVTPTPTPTRTPTFLPTATGTPELPLDCSGVTILGCDTYYYGNSSSGINRAVHYGCDPLLEESGPEDVFEVVITENYLFSAQLSPYEPTDNLDLFLLSNCSQYNCLAYSAETEGLEQISISLSPGTYYLVVDGYRGDSGPYVLNYSCPPIPTGTPTPLLTPEPLECANPIELICGVTYIGDSTATGKSNISHYSCSSVEESGPELVHTVDFTGYGTMTIILDPLQGADLDLLLLEECDEDTCLNYSSNGAGQEIIINTDTYSGTYYIVVDGYRGDFGYYELTVNCDYFSSPTPLPPIPATGSNGIVLMLVLLSILLAGSTAMKKIRGFSMKRGRE